MMEFIVIVVTIMTCSSLIIYKLACWLKLDISLQALALCGLLALIVNFSAITISPYLTNSHYLLLGALVIFSSSAATFYNERLLQHPHSEAAPAIPIDISPSEAEETVKPIDEDTEEPAEEYPEIEANENTEETAALADVEEVTEETPVAVFDEDVTEETPVAVADEDITEETPAAVADEDITNETPVAVFDEDVTEETPVAVADEDVTEEIPAAVADENAAELTVYEVNSTDEVEPINEIVSAELEVTDDTENNTIDTFNEADTNSEFADSNDILTEKTADIDEKSDIIENDTAFSAEAEPEIDIPSITEENNIAEIEPVETVDVELELENNTADNDTDEATETAIDNDINEATETIIDNDTIETVAALTTLDDLLDYAFEQKNLHNDTSALYAYGEALRQYQDDSYAPFIAIDMININKAAGDYAKAIEGYEKALTLPAVIESTDMQHEFNSGIAYINSVMQVLKAHNMENTPFLEIPQNIIAEIEKHYNQ